MLGKLPRSGGSSLQAATGRESGPQGLCSVPCVILVARKGCGRVGTLECVKQKFAKSQRSQWQECTRIDSISISELIRRSFLSRAYVEPDPLVIPQKLKIPSGKAFAIDVPSQPKTLSKTRPNTERLIQRRSSVADRPKSVSVIWC